MSDKCNTVLTIPQFTGTCWFNALLTATLYSDGMRRYLKKNLINSELYEKNKELYNIFMDIMQNKHRKMKNNDKIFFDELKPENILKLLHHADKGVFYFDPDRYIGHWGENYLVQLFKYFGLKKKILFLARDEDDPSSYLYSKMNNKSIVREARKSLYSSETRYDIHFDWKHLTAKNKETMLKNKNIDVLVVSQMTYTSFDKYNKLFQVNTKTIPEFLEYGGNVYKIDSILLTNFNDRVCKNAHQIAGVTCDNKRYLYNGWIRQTRDPGIRNIFNRVFGRKTACELMRYDWLENKDDFCLAPKRCGIDLRSSDTELCFNTSNDKVSTYIYVRVDDKQKVLKLMNTTLKRVQKRCDEEIAQMKKQTTTDTRALEEKERACAEHIREIQARIEDVTNPKLDTFGSMLKTSQKPSNDNVMASSPKKVMKKKKPKKVVRDKEKRCEADQILNPKTNRCVSKTGVVGRALMKMSKEKTVVKEKRCEAEKIR